MLPVAEHIFKGCKHAEPFAQQQLYEHCYADMVKLCLLYSNSYDDAAALYNEAMLKVFKKIHSFKGTGNLMGWIRRIVANTCIDDCRRKVKFVIYSLDEPMVQDVYMPPDVYAKISAAETLQLLKELPSNTALVFNLFVTEGYRHDEIADMLGIPVGTSKWHLNEARRLLKEKIESLSKNKSYSHVI